ncbi:MAG TPA: pseudouridine synthase [Symbiobacteriaceae bacterium]|nr:pseudouridine synthase [Symbiobacteriaceae bacterium]
MAKERLDKLLAHIGVGSRKEVRELIRNRRVRVDGVVATDPGLQVDPGTQQVLADGTTIAYQTHFHVMMHKPPGYITAADDPRKPTVMDVMPEELKQRNLMPVGRLDKDTEGLLLFTTDGDLTHRLLSPKWHVGKKYLVRLERPLVPGAGDRFAEGIELEDGYKCLPARLDVLGPQEATVVIQEGKYHQVKRMFGAIGNVVIYLKRLEMGPLILGDLPLGQCRPLTAAEIGALYDSAGLARP